MRERLFPAKHRFDTAFKPLAMAFLFALIGCGDSQNAPLPSQIPTGCSSGAALIGVYDSFLQRECGCSEAAGTPVHPPDTLTCTVPTGTAVVFHYAGAFLKHQITPTGTTQFPASPPSDPSQGAAQVKSHGILFETAGTYEFVDAFNSLLSGRVVVQ